MQRGSALRGGRRSSGFFQSHRDPASHPRGGGRGRSDSRPYIPRGRGAGPSRSFSNLHNGDPAKGSPHGPHNNSYRGRGGYHPRIGHSGPPRHDNHHFNNRSQDGSYENPHTMQSEPNFNMFSLPTRPDFPHPGNGQMNMNPNELAMQRHYQERIMKDLANKASGCYSLQHSSHGNPLIPVLPRKKKS